MPHTLSAIPHFSRPAGRATVKVPSQPLQNDKTFATLLGVEKAAKAAPVSKKLRSDAASSPANTHSDIAGFSQSDSDESANSQADTSLASNAAMANQAQFIPAVSLASYIPISGTEKDVSATQSSPSAEASLASQASRPLPQPTPATKGSRSSAGAIATAAQDTQMSDGGVRSYETAGDKQASRATIPVSEQTAAAAAVSSSATDTAATSLKTPLAPDAPAIDGAPKNHEPSPAPKLAAAQNRTAKSSEAQSSPHLLHATAAAAQSGNIPSAANSDGLKVSISDARSGITSKIAVPLSLADPVKAPSAPVVVRSQTHFVPEAAKAGNGVAAQTSTASSAQDQAATAGQVTFPPSRKQLDSELSTSTASPQNDVTPQAAAPALAPNQPASPLTVASVPSGKKTAAEQTSNMTTDGSSFADTPAENPANAVSASQLSATPNAGGGGNSHDGSAKDNASHNHPGAEPASASVDVPRSSDVSLAIPLGASSASPSAPAQQILDGIERAIPAADKSEALTSASQPTLDGQQPLKTITVALSPASLGTVAVELSLKGGQLGVKLQVQEAGTVQLLRQDGSLEKLLESAGYAVQSLSIHLSPHLNQPPQAPGPATPNGQSFSNQFSSSGSGQEQGSSQSHKGQPTDRNADQRPGYGRTEDIGGGGSLYV